MFKVLPCVRVCVRFLIQQLFLAAPAQSTVPLMLISVSALPFASMKKGPPLISQSPLSQRELPVHQLWKLGNDARLCQKQPCDTVAPLV